MGRRQQRTLPTTTPKRSIQVLPPSSPPSSPSIEYSSPPPNSSTAATVVTDTTPEPSDNDFEAEFRDDFTGIHWDRLPYHCKPIRTLKQKKSWVFKHGYRVALLKDMARTYWVCKYCHQHRITSVKYTYEVTKSTTAVLNHLALPRIGHSYNRSGTKVHHVHQSGQATIGFCNSRGLVVDQAVANQLSGFDVQGFRFATIRWLADNNHPIRELETTAFQQMIAYANPEAAAALWTSHNSVAKYVIRLYHHMQPQAAQLLSTALSKIHFSFDCWTTKGGKRGFLGLICHFVDAAGILRDLPIALPEMVGAHTGERIAEIITTTFYEFGITATQIGCFITDNARNNDTAITYLSDHYNFNPLQRRLRCAPHTINLVGQTIIFGVDKDSFGNDNEVSNHPIYCPIYCPTYSYISSYIGCYILPKYSHQWGLNAANMGQLQSYNSG